MPWRVTSIMEERMKFIIRVVGGEVSMAAACREFGISRPTGYRWLRRFGEVGNLSGLQDRSRRPHRSPGQTVEEYETRVVALRKQYGWGGKKLADILLDEGIRLRVGAVNRILKRQGLIQPAVGHPPARIRYEREQPNEMWQMDFKGDMAIQGGRCHPLSILDDHSRFAVGVYALTHPGASPVFRCLRTTFETYGIPEAMLMDHGSPWWSTTNGHGLTWLSVALIKQGIKLIWCGYRHPQTQGKVERFHRTMLDSIRHHGCPETLSGWEAALRRFHHEYNYIRPHEAIEMAVPAERYRPSPHSFNPHPREWEYPEGAVVKRLNPQGCLEYRQRRYFVCEALSHEYVRLEVAQNRLLVSYRDMYIREIDLNTGRTLPVIMPVEKP